MNNEPGKPQPEGPAMIAGSVNRVVDVLAKNAALTSAAVREQFGALAELLKENAKRQDDVVAAMNMIAEEISKFREEVSKFRDEAGANLKGAFKPDDVPAAAPQAAKPVVRTRGDAIRAVAAAVPRTGMFSKAEVDKILSRGEHAWLLSYQRDVVSNVLSDLSNPAVGFLMKTGRMQGTRYMAVPFEDVGAAIENAISIIDSLPGGHGDGYVRVGSSSSSPLAKRRFN